MTTIILASHGELAKGMLHSASMIIGDLIKDVEVFCLYPGQNPQDYAEQLRTRIQNDGESWIILADVLGGSVHTALSQLTAFGDVTILSGMNLNLVLSVLLGDHNDVSEKHMTHIMDEAKTGITYKKRIDKQEEEDF
ncbi:MAG: PTS sugar transporter subunit IIA [Longicatena sp.]